MPLRAHCTKTTDGGSPRQGQSAFIRLHLLDPNNRDNNFTALDSPLPKFPVPERKNQNSSLEVKRNRTQR